MPNLMKYSHITPATCHFSIKKIKINPKSKNKKNKIIIRKKYRVAGHPILANRGYRPPPFRQIGHFSKVLVV